MSVGHSQQYTKELSKKYFIYSYSIVETGEVVYVGMTTDIDKRHKSHINQGKAYSLKSKRQGKYWLNMKDFDIELYTNPDNYKLKVLDIILTEDKYKAWDLEEYYTNFYNPKYNLQKGRNGGGYKMSKQGRINVSIAHKGQVAWNKGKKLSEEHIRKLSLRKIGNNCHSGCNHTEETKKKISQAKKGCIWINNGVTSITIKPNDIIPEGYVKGRIFKQHK